jgi:hypothetical protein
MEPNLQDAVQFLKQLRPIGPWLLSAIIPDGKPTTRLVENEAQIAEFIRRYNGKRNLYYAVNPTNPALHDSKAKKTDVIAIEYLLADLDPNEGESPEAAKERYLKRLDGFEPSPTGIIDSGNGIQCLWKLSDAITLASEPEVKKTISEVEGRSKALMLKLGSVAGTQNIDRILRIPGTTNLPTNKKRRAGRVKCETALIKFNGATYSLKDFPNPPTEEAKPSTASKSGTSMLLDDLIKDGCRQYDFDGDRSRAVWYVILELLRRGRRAPYIEKIILDKKNGISEHILDQRAPEAYAKRQVENAIAQIDFARGKDAEGNEGKGTPFGSADNIRIALLKMVVSITYDAFADRILIDGLKDFGPALNDAAVLRLMFLMDQDYHLKVAKGLLFDVIMDMAHLNSFHPVCDYLDRLTWDGVPRIDKWLVTYAGAEESPYILAVGKLFFTAAVRRIREPGCKFDEMLVIESPQGKNKSTALAGLAKNPDWFTDSLPLNADGKKAIEMLRGRWIAEAAELSGMSTADVEHLKAFLSRQVDRARMSYDRTLTEYPRQCIVVGTTNSDKYLRDTTGNRRFWPAQVKEFDLEKLEKDRDQLWAEASARERKGESIRLDKSLWSVAAEEQLDREINDPWISVIDDELGGMEGKITSKSVWTILDVDAGRRTQQQNLRMGNAMKASGWLRPNKAGGIKIAGRLHSGYVKGEQPWKLITATRYYDKDSGEHVLTVAYGSDDDDRSKLETVDVIVELEREGEDDIEIVTCDKAKQKIRFPKKLAETSGLTM